MKEVKDPYELIKQLYAVLGRAMPSDEAFSLSGVTITIDGPNIEVAERGMVIDRGPMRIEINLDAPELTQDQIKEMLAKPRRSDS